MGPNIDTAGIAAVVEAAVLKKLRRESFWFAIRVQPPRAAVMHTLLGKVILWPLQYRVHICTTVQIIR